MDTLKELLVGDEVLVYPLEGCLKKLNYNASSKAIGGVLTQVQLNGTKRPLTYFSRILHGLEHHYPITDSSV